MIYDIHYFFSVNIKSTKLNIQNILWLEFVFGFFVIRICVTVLCFGICYTPITTYLRDYEYNEIKELLSYE